MVVKNFLYQKLKFKASKISHRAYPKVVKQKVLRTVFFCCKFVVVHLSAIGLKTKVSAPYYIYVYKTHQNCIRYNLGLYRVIYMHIRLLEHYSHFSMYSKLNKWTLQLFHDNITQNNRILSKSLCIKHRVQTQKKIQLQLII